MAKGRKRSSSGYPDPISGVLNLFGAVAMGAYARHKVKRDYEKGEGEDSVKAAMAVFGPGSFRRGTAGTVSLGGLFGVNSAIKDINKSAARPASKPRAPKYGGGPDLSIYNKANDNRYAWRLNCEDGSAYGVAPEDYESRETYNEALQKAKGAAPATGAGISEARPAAPATLAVEAEKESFFCAVSLLTSGKTKIFPANDRTLKPGDIVIVSDDNVTVKGVVVAVHVDLPDTPPHGTGHVIGKA